ncbi:MAG TPA: phosphoribosylglycinamide formyltransferase [Caldithrix sp.]|nr:phosphoribosylglycinamide formyltransferase [Caldithrix sp.]
MKNIAVFASGRGSNFKHIYQNIQQGKIPAIIKCLITDNHKAGALDFARENAIPTFTISPQEFNSSHKFGQAIMEVLSRFSIDWIVLAGYLKKIPNNVVAVYSNRILNIHPALLPAFGGKGMYGSRVHQAVFASGAKISGVTVHLVNTEYDAGPIVTQRAMEIDDCRTPEEIAAKVLKVEHVLYSEAILKVLTKKFEVRGNRVEFKNE